MGELDTDKLLGELFKENAPRVNERMLCERVAGSLPRRRRNRRQARHLRIAAAVFASVVLAAGVAYGTYRLVTYFQGQPLLVLTDSTVTGATSRAGTGSSEASTLSPEVRAQVELMTSAPLELTAATYTWHIDPEEIAEYVDCTSASAGGESSAPRLSAGKMSALFARVATVVETPAADAYFDSDGTKAWVVPAVDGKTIDAEKTAQALTAAALRSSGRTAEVVFATKQPALTTAQAEAMGIKDLLASYTTTYSGTTVRQTNVRSATRYAGASGVILAPGEEYDFDQRVGPRTLERGFEVSTGVEGPGELGDELGSAVNQVCTTLFNAVFEAGLEIVERHNSDMYVAHYPDGRDAAIVPGKKDFRFVNDTDHYLLVNGESDGVTTTFRLYGMDDGRKVTSTFSGFHDLVQRTTVTVPEAGLPAGDSVVVSQGQSGRQCEVVRTLTRADGSTKQDTFHSVWPMIPQTVEVGAGTSTTVTR